MITPSPSRKVHVPESPSGAPLEVVKYEAGADIFHEGVPGRRAFIVQTGLVEILKVTESGETLIGYVGGGEVFGEMAPIDGQPRMASARAVRDTSCIVVPEDVLARKLGEADPFVRDLLFVMVAGLRQVTEKLMVVRRGAAS